MSEFSRLSAALAAASVLVLSASAAHATVFVPKPVINIPKPAINVPRPAITTTPISLAVRPGMFAGKPATVQNTVSNWHGPAGAGTQSTSMIYQNGKLVGAISAISKYPATTAPKPTPTPAPSTSNNNIPIKPGVVVVANHPSTPTPTPAASHPAAAKPAAAPTSTPAKPKITFTPVEYLAFTDQYGVTKGYYVNGKLVYGFAGPTGGTCTPTMGFSAPGGGAISRTGGPGQIAVPAVMCYIKS